MSTVLVQYSPTASHHNSDVYAMQPYSRYLSSAHLPTSSSSPSLALDSFTPTGLFDDDDPMPLWNANDSHAHGASYHTDSFDSSSTGNSTPDSPTISPFHLPHSAASSASSVASSSTSPSPSSPSSIALVTTGGSKRKRQRLAGVTKEERMALAVIRHREIDGARRQREKEVVLRLERLTTTNRTEEKKLDDADDSNNSNSNTAAAGKRGGSRRNKREKVDVLEESAETIEQLRALVKRMEADNTAKDATIGKLKHHLYTVTVDRARGDFDDLSALSAHQHSSSGSGSNQSSHHPLALLPSATSDALTFYDGRQTLLSTGLVSSGPCLLLVQQGTGALLEANERFTSLSGYSLSDLLYTVLRPPQPGMHVRVCPLMLKHSRARGASADHTYIAQYASSRQAIIDLCSGVDRRVDLLWRQYMRNGKLYEVQYTAFVTRQGVMVWLCNLEDALLVDEWNENASVGANGQPLMLCDELTESMRQDYQDTMNRWRLTNDDDEQNNQEKGRRDQSIEAC